MSGQKQLEWYLDQLDITNTDLARTAGVTPSSVQRWLSGAIPPPVMLFRLLDCLLLLHEQHSEYITMLKGWKIENGDEDETV